MSVDFALDTVVDEGIGDDVEEGGANGCGCCISAGKAIGEECQTIRSLRDIWKVVTEIW